MHIFLNFTSYSRFPLNQNLSEDILTQTWFILLLGSIIAVIVFLFGAVVLFRRIQYIKRAADSAQGKILVYTYLYVFNISYWHFD